MKDKKLILWFKELSNDDVPIVGGKNASLGEMYNVLQKKGINIPNGFAITANAYRYFVKFNKIDEKIKNIVQELRKSHNLKKLQKSGKSIRNLILRAKFPKDLEKEIIDHYRALSKYYKQRNIDVAIRSSATAEDLPSASFAGQLESYLNIKGSKDVINNIKKCFSSLFTDRVISYRLDKGFVDADIAISVGILKMVRSDKSCSGVMFSIDSESGFKNAVLINGSYGLGENIVKGKVNPDEYVVFKPFVNEKKYVPILRKTIGDKAIKLIYSGTKTKNVKTNISDRLKYCLNDKEIIKLAQWAKIIEEHYSKRNKRFNPMDIEWAKDGIDKKLYIVQARPETIHSNKDKNTVEHYLLKKKSKIVTKGNAVGTKVGHGVANLIKDPKAINKFKPGQVLVTDITDPDWEPIMKIASAIVTDKGGRTCFSEDTNALTDKGFLSFSEIYKKIIGGDKLKILSYDTRRNKPLWKEIIGVSKNNLPAIRISISQTGRIKHNYLDVTLDHKFFTFKKRDLIKKPINNILKDQEFVNIVDYLPNINKKKFTDVKLAYLLGAFASDGSIYLTKGIKKEYRRGQVVFTQKPEKRKLEFIETVRKYFKDKFNKDLKPRKKVSNSKIGGCIIKGYVNDYRCFSLEAALYLHKMLINLPQLAMTFSNETCLHFLAGLIDGDGSFHNNRIQIYINKDKIKQATIISCLKLGIIPQVTTNRSISNIQILERMNDILNYSKKITKIPKKNILGNKLFSAKQLLSDCYKKVNFKGRLASYVLNNLLIDSRKIQKHIVPFANSSLKKELERILDSSLRMQRVSLVDKLGDIDVYNVEVKSSSELDHNYVVFTKNYTPVLVSNSHAAIISRELGIPAIVGTNNATKTIKNGQKITVSCSEGDEGFVYDGVLPYSIEKINIGKLHLPKKTKILMNLGNPDKAFSFASLPVQGIGLAREEFIISSFIRIHPLALINFKNLNSKIKKRIDKIIDKTYNKRTDYYVDKLASGISMLAASMWPNEVIVRFSDFKSNEYSKLIGGSKFEPKEENPMLGYRGASRYYSKEFKGAFKLECDAIKKVRYKIGLNNVKVMIPFCRTVNEAIKVMKILKECKLISNIYSSKRSKKELQVYVMAELPSNILLAKEFARFFDGFSIGTNDLTQLTLGLDRDSQIIAAEYDENNPAVKHLVKAVILKAKKFKRKVGICGDAPSTKPDFAKFLVENKIDTISLSPDAVVRVIKYLSK